jgi:hypothetical protein
MANKKATTEEMIKRHEDRVKLLKAKQAYDAAKKAISGKK